MVQLADLVALGQVRIEVVLAVEGGQEVDPGAHPQPRAHRLRHASLVEHGQHPREAPVHERHLRVRLGPHGRARAREELGLRRDLRGAAVLLIASKRSTVLLADRIVLLADGRIVASGTHASLSADNAAYRELLGVDQP